MIVCIGDSITAGQYLPDGERAWPDLIQDHELAVAAVSSDTTRLGLERFPRDVQERAPQLVVIQFGHNDCNRWESDRGLHRVSPRAYRANLEEMVTRCRTFKAEPLLCTITPAYKGDRYASDVAFYNELLRGVALEHNVPIIKVREAFGERGDLFLPDGLHLNQFGHQLYAATVQSSLDRRQ